MGPLVDGGDHEHGRIAVGGAVKGEGDLGPVRDALRGIGAGGPAARREPGVLELVDELAQPRPAERRLPHLGRQAGLQAVNGEEVSEAGLASAQQWRQSTG